MRSLRSPEPTRLFLCEASFACASRTCLSLMRAASTRQACSRFLCWLLASWHSTTIPVGRCVSRTAESVLLMCWPPAPLARKVSTRTSAGLELEARVGAVPHDACDHFLVAAGVSRALRDDLDLPAVALGEARVHAQ